MCLKSRLGRRRRRRLGRLGGLLLLLVGRCRGLSVRVIVAGLILVARILRIAADSDDGAVDDRGAMPRPSLHPRRFLCVTVPALYKDCIQFLMRTILPRIQSFLCKNAIRIRVSHLISFVLIVFHVVHGFLLLLLLHLRSLPLPPPFLLYPLPPPLVALVPPVATRVPAAVPASAAAISTLVARRGVRGRGRSITAVPIEIRGGSAAVPRRGGVPGGCRR